MDIKNDNMEELARGAEASILVKEGNVLKERIRKGYRIEVLDSRLRKERTKTESSIMVSAMRAGVPTPKILGVGQTSIEMEKLEGNKLRDVVDEMSSQELTKISFTIGSYIGRLHRNGIIHGDLTTSNMILSDKLYFIDFGLAFNSSSIEDQAVDLQLLSKALKSTHLDLFDKMWEGIIKGYEKEFSKSKEVLNRLKAIELRGRYVRKLG